MDNLWTWIWVLAIVCVVGKAIHLACSPEAREREARAEEARRQRRHELTKIGLDAALKSFFRR